MPQGFALALVAIGLAAALAGTQTWAAYSATSASVGNSFAAGTVALADNDSGTAVLALAGAVPGGRTATQTFTWEARNT